MSMKPLHNAAWLRTHQNPELTIKRRYSKRGGSRWAFAEFTEIYQIEADFAGAMGPPLDNH